MPIREKLHAKRIITEEHIRELEAQGNAGERYTITMPDLWFMILGLVCDAGWVIQVIAGIRCLKEQADAFIIIDLIIILVGFLFTDYLNRIHEKEIALRYQKDLSFGLVAAGGIIGIIAGLEAGSTAYITGSVLNTAGCLPIYLSFRKGIRYDVS